MGCRKGTIQKRGSGQLGAHEREDIAEHSIIKHMYENATVELVSSCAKFKDKYIIVKHNYLQRL